jgi:hypothetical protein
VYCGSHLKSNFIYRILQFGYLIDEVFDLLSVLFLVLFYFCVLFLEFLLLTGADPFHFLLSSEFVFQLLCLKLSVPHFACEFADFVLKLLDLMVFCLQSLNKSFILVGYGLHSPLNFLL